MGESDALDNVIAETVAIIIGAVRIARMAGVAGPIDAACGSLRMLARHRPDVYRIVSYQLMEALVEFPDATLH
jgi:hypothetical protein